MFMSKVLKRYERIHLQEVNTYAAPILAGMQIIERLAGLRGALESEASGQLDLAPCADGSEYSSDIVGELPRSIFEDCVAVPS